MSNRAEQSRARYHSYYIDLERRLTIGNKVYVPLVRKDTPRRLKIQLTPQQYETAYYRHESQVIEHEDWLYMGTL